MFWGLLVTSRHTHTHTHISSCSAYHPHVGKNHCSCHRSLLSGCYKRETPVYPRPVSALSKSIIWSVHLEGSSRRPHTRSVKLARDFGPYSLWLKRVLCPCEFRCDHECSIEYRHHSRPLPGVVAHNLLIRKSMADTRLCIGTWKMSKTVKSRKA